MPAAQPALPKYFDPDAIARITAVGYKPMIVVQGNLVGDHRSPLHGFAIEFAGHRQYSPGDDLKHLDWNVYFKTERYVIKQYAQETNLEAHVIIDVSESMKFEYKERRKMDYAAFIAVAVASAVLAQNDRVSATFFDSKIRESIPATGTDDIIGKISDYVEHAELKDMTSIGNVLGHMAANIGRRKCVFVISDFFNDVPSMFDGVKRLLHSRNEVVLLQVIDPIELDFDYPGQVELIQLEGEERMMVHGHNIRESYKELFDAYLETMSNGCRKLGVDYVLCNTSENFGITLAKYLNTRIAQGAR